MTVYSTSFAANENPISESGVWQSGLSGTPTLKNVQTTGGRAYGTQTGSENPIYQDSTAILSGLSWGQNQDAQATVYVPSAPTGIAEVEVRINFTMTNGLATGYEFLFSAYPDGLYAQLVRWHMENDYTYTEIGWYNPARAVQTGDTIRLVRSGSYLSCYWNGVRVIDPTLDATYLGGAPGIGFFIQGISTNFTHGFSDFAATDGTPIGTPVLTVS